MVRLDEDMHVHSTYSDGKNTLRENLQAAERAGLARLAFTDHVRRDSTWLPEYVREIESLRSETRLELVAGIEAKILSEDGHLDLPSDLDGIQYVLAADHRVVLGDELYSPGEIMEAFTKRYLDPLDVLESYLRGLQGVVERHPGVVLAHPCSMLKRLGIEESRIPSVQLERLARTSARSGGGIEISERWRCPGLRFVQAFAAAGARIYSSTDSHRAATIGAYSFVRARKEELAGDISKPYAAGSTCWR